MVSVLIYRNMGCVPNYPIQKPMANPMDENRKTINRLTISTHDWDDCLRFLQEISNQPYGSITYEALLIAAVIFYIRPFSGNERDKSEWTYHPTRVHDNGIIQSMPFSIWKYFSNSADTEAFLDVVKKVRLEAHRLGRQFRGHHT